MATVSPDFTCGANLRNAPHAVALLTCQRSLLIGIVLPTPAHINGAPCSYDTDLGSCTVVLGSANMYCAKAPSCLKPAISRPWQKRASKCVDLRLCCRQPTQLPHAFLKFSTPTRSPTFHVPVTLLPTSTMLPAGSCEGIMGSCKTLGSNWPCRTWRSEWQNPAACTWTRRSYSPHPGIGSSHNW
jgi:hypothetical protein